MARVRWTGEPAGLRAGGVRLENLALVPASLLPYKARYQRLANQLPPGAVLIVLPTGEGPERDALASAAERFLAKGHPVTTVPADDILLSNRPASAGVPSPAVARASEPMPPADVDPVPPVSAQPPVVSTATEVPAFRQELRLVRVDASPEPARFWVLQWHPTLFGGVVLVEVQGRIGRPARARVLLQADQPDLSSRIEQQVRRHLADRYQLVDWS